jgi:hypothetical protein
VVVVVVVEVVVAVEVEVEVTVVVVVIVVGIKVVLKSLVCSWVWLLFASVVVSLDEMCISVIDIGSDAGTLLPASIIIASVMTAEVFSKGLGVTFSAVVFRFKIISRLIIEY